MDPLRLAELLVEYEKLHRRMQEIEAEVEPFIMETQETQKIGNVTAKYSAGRTTYDYEFAGQEAPPEVVADNTQVVEKTDWRAVCKEAGIDAPIKSEPTPSVKIFVAS